MTPSRREVHDANVRFHSALAEAGVYEKQPFFSPENKQRVGKLLDEIVGRAPNKRLLDVGCGTGFILTMALDRFDEIEGIDLTPAMLELAPKDRKIHTQVAAIEDMPFADGTFGVVTAYGVVHHLHDYVAAFSQIRRVLKPGGVFYADESPNYYCVQALRELDVNGPHSETIKAHARAVQADASLYRERYGIDPELASEAMYQDKKRGGLREEEIRAALGTAGFSRVDYRYRWYLGQGGQPQDVATAQENFLRERLPLSRALFKYVEIVATA